MRAMQAGEVTGERWAGLDAKSLLRAPDSRRRAGALLCHPKAWNEIGFGGPASPRGYVRLDGDRRDPWEAAEATPGHERAAKRENRHVV